MSLPLHPLLVTIFCWVWKTSLAAAVLVALVLAVQTAFRNLLRPHWRYALWLLIVVRLAMPAAPASRFSIFNLRAILFPFSSPTALPQAQGRSEEPALPPHANSEEAQFHLANAKQPVIHYSSSIIHHPLAI